MLSLESIQVEHESVLKFDTIETDTTKSQITKHIPKQRPVLLVTHNFHATSLPISSGTHTHHEYCQRTRGPHCFIFPWVEPKRPTLALCALLGVDDLLLYVTVRGTDSTDLDTYTVRVYLLPGTLICKDESCQSMVVGSSVMWSCRNSGMTCSESRRILMRSGIVCLVTNTGGTSSTMDVLGDTVMHGEQVHSVEDKKLTLCCSIR